MHIQTYDGSHPKTLLFATAAQPGLAGAEGNVLIVEGSPSLSNKTWESICMFDKYTTHHNPLMQTKKCTHKLQACIWL